MSSSTIDNSDETGCIEVKNDNFTVEWIIKNFSRLPQGDRDFVLSPDFSTVNKGANCYLLLYPQGDAEDDAGYVSIYFCVESLEADENMKINAEISILPSGIRRKLQFPIIKEAKRCEKLIEKSKLQKLCGSDDTITIRCKVEIPWETMTKTRCMEQAVDSQGGLWSQAFRPLFKESTFSDVSVIVGIHKFPAHKLVLVARSPVFSAMFKNETTHENLNKEVKIEEMEPNVVEAMLEFFYTDEVTNLKEVAWGLLAAAEKYDVQRLKSMCEEVLYKTLNNDNAAEILVHADFYRSQQLKEYVMNFMADNLVDVIKLDSYKEMKLKYPALLGDIIDTIALRRETKK